MDFGKPPLLFFQWTLKLHETLPKSFIFIIKQVMCVCMSHYLPSLYPNYIINWWYWERPLASKRSRKPTRIGQRPSNGAKGPLKPSARARIQGTWTPLFSSHLYLILTNTKKFINQLKVWVNKFHCSWYIFFLQKKPSFEFSFHLLLNNYILSKTSALTVPRQFFHP